MMNTAYASALQNRVPKTKCPSCDEPHLEFGMRCEMGSTECLYYARCGRCQTVFSLDADSFPPGISLDDLESGHLHCSACHQDLAVVALACSAVSHTCRYALKCPTCDYHH
jgi:hypothetical protein